VPLAECAGTHGEEVIAFARPHELDIVLADEGAHGLPAQVRRVLPSGATARIELTGQRGPDGGPDPPHFEVEITRERLAELNLQPGQSVRLTSSRLRVFPSDRQS